jgi:chromosome segregation ATPase
MNTESDTPTPRTDAYERHYIETGNVSKLINLARDLERELAEVNEKLRQHASMLKSSDAHNNDMFCKLEKERELHSETKSELAKVTKQRDHYKKACNQYSEDEMLCKLHEVTKQRDALAEALASLLSGVKDGWFNEGKWWHTGIEQAEQALAATKGGKP